MAWRFATRIWAIRANRFAENTSFLRGLQIWGAPCLPPICAKTLVLKGFGEILRQKWCAPNLQIQRPTDPTPHLKPSDISLRQRDSREAPHFEPRVQIGNLNGGLGNQQPMVYPYPLGAGSARPNPKEGPPETENPLFIGFTALGGRLRPWSRKGPDHGIGVDPSLLRKWRSHKWHIHTQIHYITLHYITLHYITLHYITYKEGRHDIHTRT